MFIHSVVSELGGSSCLSSQAELILGVCRSSGIAQSECIASIGFVLFLGVHIAE